MNLKWPWRTLGSGRMRTLRLFYLILLNFCYQKHLSGQICTKKWPDTHIQTNFKKVGEAGRNPDKFPPMMSGDKWGTSCVTDPGLCDRQPHVCISPRGQFGSPCHHTLISMSGTKTAPWGNGIPCNYRGSSNSGTLTMYIQVDQFLSQRNVRGSFVRLSPSLFFCWMPLITVSISSQILL